MSKIGMKGAVQKGVGSVKDATGKVTGNDKLRAEGKVDKAVGSAKESAGKTQDKMKKATK